jgi:hypothetical protein
MGQDRKFTESEIEFVEKWVKLYRDNWERAETESLRKDINLYIERKEADASHAAEN